MYELLQEKPRTFNPGKGVPVVPRVSPRPVLWSHAVLCVCLCVAVVRAASPLLASYIYTHTHRDRQTQTQTHTYTRTHPHPHTCVPLLPFLLLPNYLFRVPVQMLTLEVQCALPFHCRSWGVCIHSYQSPGQTAPAHPAARLHLGALLDAAPHEASPPPPSKCSSVVVHLRLGGGVRRRATAAKFP
jgi:hypothetical protein